MNDMKWCLAVSIGILKITLPPAIGVKKVTLERGRHGVALRGGAAAFFRSKSDESSDNLPPSLPRSLSVAAASLPWVNVFIFRRAPLRHSSVLSSVPRRPSVLGRTDGMNAEECVT